MTLFNKFAKYVLDNPEKKTVDLYNGFMKGRRLTEGERRFLADNYMLVIKVGDAARNAMLSVKKILS